MNDIFTTAGVTKDSEKDCWIFSVPLAQDGETSVQSNAALEKTSSKKKKRTKKKVQPIRKRGLTWGNVHEFLFSRSVSFDAVPTNGMYPIGLGEYLDEICYPINEALNSKKSEFMALDEKQRFQLIKSCRISVSREAVEVNKDLKQVRESRQRIGCSCKPLKVDKLNINKLKTEIISRDVHSSLGMLEGLKKSEMAKILRDLMKNCQICIDENCECVKFGVPCNPLACSCIRTSNLSVLGDPEDLSEQDTRNNEDQSCGNPSGQDILDTKSVQNHRAQILRRASPNVK